MADIIFYTRAGCHLCEEAATMLTRFGLPFESVDIDADPQLRARYDQCVPVIVFDGKERFRGCIDELLLRRLLAQREPPASD